MCMSSYYPSHYPSRKGCITVVQVLAAENGYCNNVGTVSITLPTGWLGDHPGFVQESSYTPSAPLIEESIQS